MPKTILCIDDDPFYKDLFKAMLEPHGYNVVSALDPAEGWSKLATSKPDLITLDIMMPEKEGFFDGFGFLKKLRTESDFKTAPVIMISALGDPEDIKHGISSGATDFLPKQDMTPDILLAKVKKILGE